MDLATTFAGKALSDDRWEFQLAERWNGAFGGTNGGLLCALAVHVARRASGRQPTSVDARFLRGFRPGRARLQARRLSEGRTLSVIAVDVLDDDDRLCTHAVATLADPAALAGEIERPGGLAPPHLRPADACRPWPQPPGRPIPLIESFQPTEVARGEHEVCTAVTTAWEEPGTAAEAACVAADISVGPPVMRGVRAAGARASTPNPDLSLRFLREAPPTPRLVASCALDGIAAGLATTRIAVWQEALLLAIGVSTTTCIPVPGGP